MRRQSCLLAKDSGQTLQTCSSAMTFLDLELYHFFKMLMVLVQRDSKNSKNWQFRSEQTELQQGHHQEAPQEMQVAFTVPCKG